MSNGKTTRGYVDRSGRVWSILDSDDTLAEILTTLDPDADRVSMLTPWRRGFVVAMRSAFEH